MSLTNLRPSLPILILKSSSSINFIIAFFISSGCLGSTINPVLLLSKDSGWPPTLVTITGTSQACDSIAATPKPSLNDGNTVTSKLQKVLATFSGEILPKNSTSFSKPNSFVKFTRLSKSLPEPPILSNIFLSKFSSFKSLNAFRRYSIPYFFSKLFIFPFLNHIY